MKTSTLGRAWVVIAAGICLLFMASPVAADDDGFSFKFYGFVLANGNYNTSTTGSSDVPVTAKSEDDLVGIDEGDFQLTARQSRLGVSAAVADIGGGFNINGKVEMDFFGRIGSAGAGGVTQAAPRMRLAFMQLNRENLVITIGQDWVKSFAPIAPSSLAHVIIAPFTATGNLWNRIPQIRLDYTHKFDEGFGIDLSGAILRPHGGDFATASQVDSSGVTGEGERSKAPFVNGRVAVRIPIMDENTAVIGVSGHYGQENAFASDGITEVDVDTNAIAFDLTVPFGMVTLKGEYYTGQNLNTYFALAGSGRVGMTDVEAMDTDGGWVGVAIAPNEKVVFNLAYGLEDVDDKLLAMGAVDKNSSFFANLIWKAHKHFKMGFEYNHITTEYVGKADGENDQINVAFQFPF